MKTLDSTSRWTVYIGEGSSEDVATFTKCTDVIIDESSPWVSFKDANGRQHFASGTIHIEEEK